MASGRSLDAAEAFCNHDPMLATATLALQLLAAVAVGNVDEAVASGGDARPKLCEVDNWNLATGKLGPADASNGRIYHSERLRVEVWVPEGFCINARDVFEWQVNYLTISRPDRPDAKLHLGPYQPRKDARFSSWRQWTERHHKRARPGKVQSLSGWPVLWLPATVTKSGRHRRIREMRGIIGLGVRAPDDEGYAYFAVLEWELPFAGAQEFEDTVAKMLSSLKVSAPPK